MGNIQTYLKWRGDLTFEERPFCDVDNLILAELSYVEFNDILRDETDTVSVREAANLLAGETENKYLEMLSAMAESRRFQNLFITRYTETFEEETCTDFSAVCIHLDEKTSYVSFRGTRNYIMGWREDFSMSYQLMPSQPLAAKYLMEIMTASPNRSFYIGGHSKGGNLALYSAMMCPEILKDRIISVYSNDGPGVCFDLIEKKHYEAIRPKLVRIVPEFSVIGALFEYDKPDFIVKSSYEGILQHDGLSWEIEGDQFVTCEKRSSDSVFINDIFDEWLESASMEQRESFTKDFFDALEAGGAKKTSEISGSSLLGMEDILLTLVDSEENTKKAFGSFFRTAMKAIRRLKFGELFLEQQFLQGIAAILLGLFFLGNPETATQWIGKGLALAGIIYFGNIQYLLVFPKEEKKQKYVKPKFFLHMILMCVLSYLIAQGTLLETFSNLLIGVFFLFLAYKVVVNIIRTEGTLKRNIILVIVAVMLFAIGVIPIISTELVMTQYMIASGSFILLLGVDLVVYEIYLNEKKNRKHELR